MKALLCSKATTQVQVMSVPGGVQNETVINIANKHGKSPAQVLIAWGLQHGTSVIPRSVVLSQQKVCIPSHTSVFRAVVPCKAMSQHLGSNHTCSLLELLVPCGLH